MVALLSHEWFLSVDGVKTGPFSVDQILGLYADKELVDSQLTTTDALGSAWITVHELYELQEERKKPFIAPFAPPSRPSELTQPGFTLESLSRAPVPPPSTTKAPMDPAISLFDALQAAKERKSTTTGAGGRTMPPEGGAAGWEMETRGAGGSSRKYAILALLLLLMTGFWAVNNYMKGSSSGANGTPTQASLPGGGPAGTQQLNNNPNGNPAGAGGALGTNGAAANGGAGLGGAGGAGGVGGAGGGGAYGNAAANNGAAGNGHAGGAAGAPGAPNTMHFGGAAGGNAGANAAISRAQTTGNLHSGSRTAAVLPTPARPSNNSYNPRPVPARPSGNSRGANSYDRGDRDRDERDRDERDRDDDRDRMGNYGNGLQNARVNPGVVPPNPAALQGGMMPPAAPPAMMPPGAIQTQDPNLIPPDMSGWSQPTEGAMYQQD
jgi:hypothetical protein